jgi:hypothetical protein
MPNLTLAAQNVARAAFNRVSKLGRRGQQQSRRLSKQVRESTKAAKASVRGASAASRDVMSTAYSGTVRMSRYWSRMGARIVPRVTSDAAVRFELWRLSRGSGPIVVGPWLSEVGYEALYWVPFVRWFVDYYRVDPARVIAVSRGGVSGWYDGIAGGYVELLELYSSEEFAARNRARQDGQQKQFGLSAMDDEIVRAVYRTRGIERAAVCHPSAMFRLLRQFWLGNESLDYALGYLRYAPLVPTFAAPVPSLPDDFVAMKFYRARSLGMDDRHRHLLRALVKRIAERHPVVLLGTGMAFDEHEDFLFAGVPGVTNLAPQMRPESNLGLQTEVIRRARRFVGTCGSLAWLAPMLGTDTLAVYSDDHLLTSHLYAARHAYGSMSAARFDVLDLNALEQTELAAHAETAP